MLNKGRDRKHSPEPRFKVRQILILIALVLAFAFVVRMASGDPLPHDLRNFFEHWRG